MVNLLSLDTASTTILLIVLGIIIVFITAFFVIVPVKIWFRCLVSGTYVGMGRLVGMRFRKINVSLVIDSYINAKKAGLTLTVDELETHYMAGGNVNNVVQALIAAHSAQINLSSDTAKTIDLAGRDVLKAVKESITPKVIKTPLISAVAKDGIEVKVLARVTVKTNINKLIGGAGEETIISRVGEGVVTTVGSSETHKDVLENPDMISQVVLQKGLDDGTAYQILSIDIADVDIGENIGAELRKLEAQADMEIAEAKAAERKAMAIAAEQEMKAKVQEMKADVVKAEAEVPKALADAFRTGKIGVMDYYRMQNIEADTNMRKAISSSGKPSDNNSDE